MQAALIMKESKGNEIVKESAQESEEKIKSLDHSMSHFMAYLFLQFMVIATAWLLGTDNHDLLRIWFPIGMTALMLIRIPDFIKQKYHHFLGEMCYFVNYITMGMMMMGTDIRIVFPFLHGPLMLYAITSGDGFIPHDLSRTTSFAIHAFGTVVSRRLYWHGNETLLLSLSDLFPNSFVYYLKSSFLIYLVWFLPYSCYVFWYKGKSLTMLRYTMKTEEVYITTKIRYLVWHLFNSMFSVSFGILCMHSFAIDSLMVSLQIFNGFLQGGYYYYSGGKRLKFKFLKNLV